MFDATIYWTVISIEPSTFGRHQASPDVDLQRMSLQFLSALYGPPLCRCASLLGGLVLGAFNGSLGYESLENEELGSFIGVFEHITVIIP